MDAARRDRWRRRPGLAAAVRVAVFVTPIGAGVAATAAIAPHLPPAHGTLELAALWFVAFAFSAGVVYLTHVSMRRVMPLAVLLTLSLVFPDEAPSRLKVARTAMSTARLRERVERARADGVDDEPTRAAEQILGLVAAVEAHDRGTRGHSERVRLYTDLLADEMSLSVAARDRLRWAALLHDVGKLMVPGEVLNKPGALDEQEWDLVRRHPDEGARLTAPLRPWLREWACAIEEHHERYDGSGYPRGLTGEEISLAGRMVAVTDAFETMTAARPYRRPIAAGRARAELVRCAGTDFDPTIVRAFVGISIRRLSLLTGPLSWLAQTPLLRGLELAMGSASRAAAGAAVGGALALTVAPPLDLPPPSADRPAASETRANAAEESDHGVFSQADGGPSDSSGSDPERSPEPSLEPSREPSASASPSRIPSPSPSATLDPWRPEPSPTPLPSKGDDGPTLGGSSGLTQP